MKIRVFFLTKRTGNEETKEELTMFQQWRRTWRFRSHSKRTKAGVFRCCCCCCFRFFRYDLVAWGFGGVLETVIEEFLHMILFGRLKKSQETVILGRKSG